MNQMPSFTDTLKALPLLSRLALPALLVGTLGCIVANMQAVQSKKVNSWHIGGMGLLAEGNVALGKRNVIVAQISADGEGTNVKEDVLQGEHASEYAALKTDPTPENAMILVTRLARYNNLFPNIDIPAYSVVIQDEIMEWEEYSIIYRYNTVDAFTLLVEGL